MNLSHYNDMTANDNSLSVREKTGVSFRHSRFDDEEEKKESFSKRPLNGSKLEDSFTVNKAGIKRLPSIYIDDDGVIKKPFQEEVIGKKKTI